MSRVREVLRNKNKVEKSQRARRKDEIQALRTSVAFKANLKEQFKVVNVLLNSPEVDSLIITVPDTHLALFGEAIYLDLSEYDIAQVENEPNKFRVRYRYLF